MVRADSSFHKRPIAWIAGVSVGYQQEVFVGKSNEEALAEAFTFPKIVKKRSYPLRRSLQCWISTWVGGASSIFLNDVDAACLHGVDVDEAVLDMARSTGVAGNLSRIGSSARLPYDDGYFDVIYSFSVFSHLFEVSAKFGLSELMRVLAPCGTLVMTTTTDHFPRALPGVLTQGKRLQSV
ncbi:methyltransferase domain-containing protein [Xanthomonas theicola]|uniref:methyltransferase domain-containing protein n=1 Tax=Xanthomonas theicola TaxID=56464 RepID=UPI001FEADDE9|nr:methyltransferase domain-containing protein [Xanthomonas theicola]